MNRDKVHRVAIVGASGITTKRSADPPLPFQRTVQSHDTVSHAMSLAMIPNVEVVGICDLVPELTEQFINTWTDRWPNAKGYTDHKEMLRREDLDVLVVATGDNAHADITVDGANAGVKGIFCEKPLAISVKDVDRMIKACEDNGTTLSVDHTRRWSPVYHKVREAVREGVIGRLSTVVVNHGGRRAMLFRNGTHFIDGICFFAESEPVKVFARLEDGFDDWDEYKGDGGKTPEKDPAASGFILFRNGVRAFYNGDKDQLHRNTTQLTGPKGQIFFAHNDRTATLTTLSTPEAQSGEFMRTDLTPDQYQVHGMVAGYTELLRVVENGGESGSSGREARKTVQILQGFLRSNREGSRLVDVPE